MKKLLLLALSVISVSVLGAQKRVKGAKGGELGRQVFTAYQDRDTAKLDTIARQVGNTPMGRLAQVYSAYLKQDRTALANLLAQGVQQAQKYLDQLQQQAQAAAVRPAVVPPPLPPRRVGPPPVPPRALPVGPPPVPPGAFVARPAPPPPGHVPSRNIGVPQAPPLLPQADQTILNRIARMQEDRGLVRGRFSGMTPMGLSNAGVKELDDWLNTKTIADEAVLRAALDYAQRRSDDYPGVVRDLPARAWHNIRQAIRAHLNPS